ncbi:MAG: hypothetical protein E6G32_11960 [Actinobacteria bacterium]|nr:MAG: hypothetical protein E6G32_11960 [Actinomycetota bacterium]
MWVRCGAPLAVAMVLAGCGNPVHSHYSVKQTAPCLRKLGYAVSTNASQNSSEAGNVEAAYRRFVSKKLRPHIDDVMLSQKNAVLLWTITPPKDELNRVLGCLK